MNDLELLDKFCEEYCKSGFIPPLLFRDVDRRGLVWVIDRVPSKIAEAKVVVRARLAKVGRTFGDPEIDQIANEIKRLEYLRKRLTEMNMANVDDVIPILDEMQTISHFLLAYYKK